MARLTNLTDKEWFNLIAGMVAGLHLRDKAEDNYSSSISLKPIGVGGYGTIGIKAGDVLYTGVNSVNIPVFTHDVDISYSGFTFRMEYDTNRLSIIDIIDGEFGSVEQYMEYSIANGILSVQGLRDYTVEFNEPKILFIIRATVIGSITVANPIKLKVESSTGYDPTYTTLVKWVLNNEDNNYYNYYITPTINPDGSIYVDEDKNNTQDISETENVALANKTGIYLSSARYPNVIPIMCCMNKDDNFAYNKVEVILDICSDETYGELFSPYKISPADGWTITSQSLLENNRISFTATREDSKVNTSTIGALEYSDNIVIDTTTMEFSATVAIMYGRIYNDDTLFTNSVEFAHGNIYNRFYNTPPWSSGGGGGGYPSYPYSGGSGGSGGGAYGTQVQGRVWSSTEQIIWISIGDGPKIPVKVQPGWNDVDVFIPDLNSEDISDETEIKIEAPGYLLIPAGLSIIKKRNPDTQPCNNQRMIESFNIVDVYDVEVINIPEPVDLDGLIDELDIEDIHEIDVIATILLSDNDNIDDMSIVDDTDLELIEPIVPVDLDGCIDDVEIEDIHDTLKKAVATSETESVEDISVEDTWDYEEILVATSETESVEDISVEDISLCELN